MVVQVTAKLDSARFHRELYKNAEGWPKAVDMTMKTMVRRAPVIVARKGAETYNIAAARLNPRNKKSKGSVSLSGGITDMTLTYTGQKLPVTDFKGIKPRGARKRPYTITGEIVHGQVAKLGHWNRPGSEGGAYGAQSPWMYLPGITAPVQRTGAKFGGMMRALSVPQMVVSVRTDKTLLRELQDTMADELERQLEHYGLS